MIIRPFENKYDEKIYDYIANNPEYNKLVKKKDSTTKEYAMKPVMSEGEKSILYDLVHEIKNYVRFDWSEIDIPEFIENCHKGYEKSKNAVLLQVIANCINICFKDKVARLETISMNEPKQLVITNRQPKKKKEVEENE